MKDLGGYIHEPRDSAMAGLGEYLSEAYGRKFSDSETSEILDAVVELAQVLLEINEEQERGIDGEGDPY